MTSRSRRTDLDFLVQHSPNLCHSTGQVEVTCRAMAYPTPPLLHQLQLLFLQMHGVRKNRVVPQQAKVIIHSGVRDRLSLSRKMREKLLRQQDLRRILRDVRLYGEGGISSGELANRCHQLICRRDSEPGGEDRVDVRRAICGGSCIRLGWLVRCTMEHTFRGGQRLDIFYQLHGIRHGFLCALDVIMWALSVHVTFLSPKKRESVYHTTRK